MTFLAFALRRHFPIRLRRWRFKGSPFVVTFRLDYVRRWRFERSPFIVTFRLLGTKMTFRAIARRRRFPIRLQRWLFERSPGVVTFRLDYEDDVSIVRPSSELTSASVSYLFTVEIFIDFFNTKFECKMNALLPKWHSLPIWFCFLIFFRRHRKARNVKI